MSPLEFLRSVPNYASFSRRSCVVLFAYYLREHSKVLEFSTSHIKSCFEGALLRVPTDLAELIKDQATGKDAPLIRLRSKVYGLSVHGVDEVEAVLPQKSSPGASSGLSAAALSYLQRTVAKVTDAQRREF